MLQRTNTRHEKRHPVVATGRTIAMARITQLASVAIGLMTQGILLGIVIGA
jgi:hypothetical protein